MSATEQKIRDFRMLLDDRLGQDADLWDSVKEFKRRMDSDYNALKQDYQPGPGDSEWEAKILWTMYASAHEAAGYAFEEIERLIKGLEKEVKVKREAHTSSLWYLREAQNSIPLIWEEYLMNWPRKVRSGDITLEYCELQVVELEETLVSLVPVMDLLDLALLADKQDPDIGYEDIDEDDKIDLHIYVTAARSIFRRLQAIKPRLKKVVAALASHESFNERENEHGLRRRAVRSSSQASTAAESSQNEVVEARTSLTQRSLTTGMARYFDRLGVTAASWGGLSRTRIKRYALDQSTLWTMAVAIGVISGCIVTSAIMQTRPPACVPSYGQTDDGALSLIAQVLVQLLSLYATLLPILRDNRLPVRSFWFFTMLGLSAIATTLSPVVYAKSWQASTLLSYFAAMFGMMSTAQLAGSVEDISAVHDLAR